MPFLEGKSSIGRLGIDIHATAGKGDVGFCNHWTLEISVKQPIRVYAGMPVGQLIYFTTTSDVTVRYDEKASAKYNTRTNKPVESMMWKNFEQKLFVEIIEGGDEVTMYEETKSMSERNSGELQEVLNQYLDRLHDLHRQVAAWLEPRGLSCKTSEITFAEPAFDEYAAPQLAISDSNEVLVATVVPNGANAVGGDGQVIFEGRYGRVFVSYYQRMISVRKSGEPRPGIISEPILVPLFTGFSGPGWYLITDAVVGIIEKLDEPVLMGILSRISAYGIRKSA